MSTGYQAPQGGYSQAPQGYPQGPPQAPQGSSIEDMVIGAVPSIDKTADQIDEEKSFRQPTVGDHRFRVLGFFGEPKLKTKEVFVAGQRHRYNTNLIKVRLGVVGDIGCQVIDNFELPPDDPAAVPAYLYGSDSPDGKNAGMMASKFYQFIGRLGFPSWEPGAPMPAEARRLGNWKGREIAATVTAAKPYTDQSTGEWKEGTNSIKLFSYRDANSINPSSTVPQRPVPSAPNQPSLFPPQGLAGPRVDPQVATYPPPAGMQMPPMVYSAPSAPQAPQGYQQAPQGYQPAPQAPRGPQGTPPGLDNL
jgi:hypothetical protein